MELVDHSLKVGPYDQPPALTNQEENPLSLNEKDIGNFIFDEPNQARAVVEPMEDRTLRRNLLMMRTLRRNRLKEMTLK